MTFRTLVLTAALVAALPALAHAPKLGRNGGPQANAGAFHLEILAKGATLAVYLRDHADREVKTDGYTGAATFTIGGKTLRIDLAPDGDNRLKGTAPAPLPAAPKGAVRIITPTGAAHQGQFD